MQALGKCGGPVALEALTTAAFHPGFSRAAEAASSDPLRRRPPRKEEERWRPDLPEDLRTLGSHLAAALARWKDAELCAALRRRLDALRADGRVYAVSEEWLLWLGNALADPPATFTYRPRWWAKVTLLRQVLANPPRLTEADHEAARVLFTHESEVSMEYAGALRTLEAWRSALRIHDPVRADREARLLDSLGAVVAAAEDLRRTGDAAAAAAAFERAFEAGREDRTARLVATVLTDLDREPALAVRYGESAVRAHASYEPNLRSLGEARLAAGDAAGAAEILGLAVESLDGTRGEPTRTSAWYRFFHGRALAILGEREEALLVLAVAARINDTVLDHCERDPALAPLREGGRLDEALEPARRWFDQ